MTPIKIFIADDKKDICESLADNVIIELQKFDLTPNDVHIVKCFTEHAYEHGCKYVTDGFVPDICIFDLVFNGYTGVDLYKFIINHVDKKPSMCIYTGVEKKFEKRKEAEALASTMDGYINIVAKPNVSEVLDWLTSILEKKYRLTKKIEEVSPFDLL